MASVSACRQAKSCEPAFHALRKLPPSFRPDRGVYLSLAGLIRDSRSSHLVPEVIDHALSQRVALDPVVLGVLFLFNINKRFFVVNFSYLFLSLRFVEYQYYGMQRH